MTKKDSHQRVRGMNIYCTVIPGEDFKENYTLKQNVKDYDDGN